MWKTRSFFKHFIKIIVCKISDILCRPSFRYKREICAYISKQLSEPKGISEAVLWSLRPRIKIIETLSITDSRALSQYKDGLSRHGISIKKTHDRLNFMMWMPILVRRCLYIETISDCTESFANTSDQKRKRPSHGDPHHANQRQRSHILFKQGFSLALGMLISMG